MAGYGNHVHMQRSRNGLSYDAYNGDQHWYDSDIVSDESPKSRTSVLIAFIFVLELIVLAFLSVLEYFLRATSAFPVRELTFDCYDTSINYTSGQSTYADFSYHAEVPYEAIVIICFCLPPFLIAVFELAVWVFTTDEQKSVLVLCRQCRMPQIIRRVMRFTGTFVFGLLITMVFTDVIKFMIGRLRPTFLDACKPNMTLCIPGHQYRARDVCTQTDASILRDARLSFPSIQASMTAFAAGYMAIYIHNIISRRVRALRPYVVLGFILMSVLCCLARYGLHYSHWTDVAVGFGLGIIFAVYIGVFVLNNFQERLGHRKFYRRLHSFLAQYHHDNYAEGFLHHDKYSAVGNGTGLLNAAMIIPRPQLHSDASTDIHGLPDTINPVQHRAANTAKYNGGFQYELDGFGPSQSQRTLNHI